MKNRRMNLIKNQSGSALPFVIILGFVLLLTVASLMTVATSGINQTQKSVESRQAYIDAKSVTEYGQVLIEEKIAEMQSATLPDKTVSNEDGDVIFYINGVRTNPTDPLTFEKADVASPTTIGVGKLKWKQTVVTGDVKNGTATTTYTISVETQNLRRKLNYARSIDYKTTTTTTPGTGTIPQAPTQPQKPTVVPSQFGVQTTITNNKTLQCNVGGNYGIGNATEKNSILSIIPTSNFNTFDINLTGFGFLQQKTLILQAHQIAVSTAMPNVWKPTFKFGLKEGDTYKTDLLYFAKGYTPGGNESTNVLKAKNIVIIGNLNLAYASTLDIDCENLWITGNVSLPTQTSVNTIKAKNIIISGGLNLGHDTALTIDCPNVWLNGNLTTESSTPVLTFKNVQYLKTGTMNLNDKMKLTIVGDPSKVTNQVEVGSLDTTSTGQQINITGLYYFNCLGNITQSWSNATINIESKIVLIGGNLSLTGINAGNFKILTEYFICKGNALLAQITGAFYIGNPDSQTSCIKFDGTYTQTDAIVMLYGNKNIVFGGNVILSNWGQKELDLTSDNIYFNNSIDAKNNKVICKGVTDPFKANVLLKKQASNPGVGVGKYVGYTTKALNDPTLKPGGTFEEIPFPPQPTVGGSTEGTTTSTQEVVPGQEKYY